MSQIASDWKTKKHTPIIRESLMDGNSIDLAEHLICETLKN